MLDLSAAMAANLEEQFRLDQDLAIGDAIIATSKPPEPEPKIDWQKARILEKDVTEQSSYEIVRPKLLGEGVR